MRRPRPSSYIPACVKNAYYQKDRGMIMPRYLVERSFPQGLTIPINSDGENWCLSIALNNEEDSVTWLHSYVSENGTKTFCIYDGPSPEAIRRTATRNSLPVDRITEVRVLVPYFYR
jgi:hypothetical protein